MFREVPDTVILVCGGDGTVGWVMDVMGSTSSKLSWSSSWTLSLIICLFSAHHDDHCVLLDKMPLVHQAKVAVIPLGTGNDLARFSTFCTVR